MAEIVHRVDVTPRTQMGDRPFRRHPKSYETMLYNTKSLQKVQNGVTRPRSVQVVRYSHKGTSRLAEELAAIIRSRTIDPRLHL